MQIAYKTLWIVAVGIPLSLQGDPRALPFVIFFALITAGFIYAVPFRYLFGGEASRATFKEQRAR